MALDLGLRINSIVGAPERPSPGTVHRDMELLAPAFRMRVGDLLLRMVAAGHDPMVWETYRTPARAAFLASTGRGVVGSMHCLGCAGDIISASKKWNAPFSFWRDLRDNAEALGLVSGARFSRRDMPHVQAIPVARQALARRLFAERGQSAVNQYVATVLA